MGFKRYDGSEWVSIMESKPKEYAVLMVNSKHMVRDGGPEWFNSYASVQDENNVVFNVYAYYRDYLNDDESSRYYSSSIFNIGGLTEGDVVTFSVFRTLTDSYAQSQSLNPAITGGTNSGDTGNYSITATGTNICLKFALSTINPVTGQGWISGASLNYRVTISNLKVNGKAIPFTDDMIYIIYPN